MSKILKSPRRNLVLAGYAIAFIICVPVLKLSAGLVILVLLLLTAAFVLIFFSSVVAVMGNYLFALGKEEKGAAYLKKALDMNTASPAAHINYAIWRLRAGDADEALSCLEKARAKNPDIMARKNIDLTSASCHWVKGDIEAAITVLNGMIHTYEYVNAHVLSTLGYMLLVKGDLAGAEEYTRKALEEEPSLSSAWDNLGQIAFNRNEKSEAKEHFNKALEFKPNLPDSLYYLALIHEEEGDFLQALRRLDIAKDSKITALNTVTREQVESLRQKIEPLARAQELLQHGEELEEEDYDKPESSVLESSQEPPASGPPEA
ncbi:MAG: tetratricopeptide repeat protein [Clostridiales bacterium]|nr:tetratricopeptide repeat protein [Clostridiales bacterium]